MDADFKWIQYVIVVLHMLYICATTPHQKKKTLGLSPLHFLVFDLFDNLHDTFLELYFDNLCMNVKFSFASFTKQPKKIKVQVMCSIGGRGVTKEVIEHEVTDKKYDLIRYVLFIFIYNLSLSGPKFVYYIVYFELQRNRPGICVGRHR